MKKVPFIPVDSSGIPLIFSAGMTLNKVSYVLYVLYVQQPCIISAKY